MTISFSGLASGLDTSSWVESLVALKKAKVATLEEQKDTAILTKETIENIKSFFSSFQSVLSKVTQVSGGGASTDLFTQKLAISSNTNIVTGSASALANEATYKISVDKLATTTEALSNFATTYQQTTLAGMDSKLTTLGVNINANGSNIGVLVNGVEHGIALTQNDTIATFIDKLKGIGVDASYNTESGVFSINVGANDIIDHDSTGICNALNLTSVNEGYESGTLKTTRTDTIYEAATLGTTIYQIADATDNSSLKQALNNGNQIVRVHANGEHYDIVINNSTTIGDFITALQSHDVDASLDATGVFTLTDATIDDTVGIGNLLMQSFGLSIDIYSKSQVSTNLNHEVTTVTSTVAKRDTLITDLWEGTVIDNAHRTVEIKNSDNQTTIITLTTSSTIGSLLSAMTEAGLYAAINTDGTIEIAGGNIIGGTFDAITVLGLEEEPYTAMVTGSALVETVIVHNTVELGTRLVDDLGITEGYLEVTTPDETKYYEKIYSGQTISDLMADLANLGIYTELDELDGILTITGGAFATLTDADVVDLVNHGTIVEPNDRYHHGTNLIECLYGTPQISLNHTSVSSTRAKSKAMTQKVTETVLASTTSTLGNLGLDVSGGNTAVFDVRGNLRTITVSQSTTVQGLMDKLSAVGIESTFDEDTHRIHINNATLSSSTSNLDDVLNLTTEVSGKYKTSSVLYSQTTITIDATRNTSLKDYGILNSMSTAQKTVTIFNSEGTSLGTTVVGEGTSIGNLIDFINSKNGVSASIEDGVLVVHNGYITNATLENSMGLETSNKTSYVLGSIMTTTSMAAVTGDTKLGDIISSLGTTSAVSGGYNLYFNSNSVAVDANTTLNQLINRIYDAGGTAVLDSTGRLSINGGTLTGSVATALGVTSTTHTLSVSATGNILETTQLDYADRDTKLSDLGINSSSYVLHDKLGNAISTVNLTGTTTLGQVLDGLSTNGIEGIIANGVIALNSADGRYITGALTTSLGITYETTTTTVNTTQSSTLGITHTGTVTATTSTTLGEIGAILSSDNTIYIYDGDQTLRGSITNLTTTSTVQDLFNELERFGITGSIDDGVINLYSPDGWYATGAPLTRMGISFESGIGKTLTVGQTVTSSVEIQITDVVKATEARKISEFITLPSNKNVVIKDVNNNEIGTIVVDSNTTFGSLFSSLSAYGIDGDIHDGVILLTSTDGSYVTGDVMTTLGINTVSSTTTTTVAVTSTSTAGISYTTTVKAQETDKISDYITLPSNKNIVVHETDGSILGTVTVGNTTTFDQLFEALSNYGIDGDIHNGTIFLASADSKYITGDVATALGITVGSSTVTLTLGSQTTSTASISYTYNVKANENDKISDFITLPSNKQIVVYNSANVAQTTITLDGTSTFGSLFAALSPYEIDGDIHNGVIALTSANGSYATGAILSSLGINTTSATVTSTAGVTSTSTAVISYTDTVKANENDKISDFVTISNGSIIVHSTDGANIGTVVVNNTTTFDSLFASLSAYGIDGDIHNGTIILSSDDSTYITGQVATALGINVGTSTITVTTGVTSTSTAGISYTYNVKADDNDKISDFITLPSDKKIVVYNKNNVAQATINVDSTTTFGGLFASLAAYGIDGDIDNGVVSLSAANGSYATGAVLSTMGMGTTSAVVTTTVGKTQTSSAVISYTDTVKATESDKISDIISITNGSIIVHSTDGANIGTVVVNNTTTFDSLFASLSAYGIDGDIHNGTIILSSTDSTYITGAVPTALGINVGTSTITETYGTSQTSTANVSYTQTLIAEDDDKISDFITLPSNKQIVVYNKNNVAQATINVDSTTTFGGLFASLAAHGIDGDLDNGVISLSSASGAYATGAVLSTLGMTTSSSTVTTTVGLTTSSTASISYTGTVFATDADKISDFITLPSNKQVVVNNSAGTGIATINVTSTTTFGELFNSLASHGINATIHNGKITVTGTDGQYITGDVATTLGINVTTQTTTSTVGGTMTSSAGISYTETHVASATDNILDYVTVAGDKQVIVKNSANVALTTITVNATTKFSDLFGTLAGYGIDADIDNGTVMVTSVNGNYITGSVTTALGINTTSTTVTQTIGVTSSQSSTAISRTVADIADESDKISSFITLPSNKVITVSSETGTTVGTVTLDANTTFGGLFASLAALGIQGDLNNGYVELNSAIHNYATGDVLTSLGISTATRTVSTTATSGMTTGITVTSSAPVTYTYTGTELANENSVINDFIAIAAGGKTAIIQNSAGTAIGTITVTQSTTFGQLSGMLENYGIDSYLVNGVFYTDSPSGNHLQIGTGTFGSQLGLTTSGVASTVVTGTNATSTAAITYTRTNTAGSIKSSSAPVTYQVVTTATVVTTTTSEETLTVGVMRTAASPMTYNVAGSNTVGTQHTSTADITYTVPGTNSIGNEKTSTADITYTYSNTETVGYEKTSNSSVTYNESTGWTYASSDSTFGEVGIGVSTMYVHNSLGSKIATIVVSDTETIGSLLNTLRNSYGFSTAYMDDGRVYLASSDGNYVSGAVASSLYLSSPSTSSGSNVTVGKSNTSTASISYTVTTSTTVTTQATATSSTTLDEIGLHSGGTISINGNSTTFSNSDTLSSVCSWINSNAGQPYAGCRMFNGCMTIDQTSANSINGTIASAIGLLCHATIQVAGTSGDCYYYHSYAITRDVVSTTSESNVVYLNDDTSFSDISGSSSFSVTIVSAGSSHTLSYDDGDQLSDLMNDLASYSIAAVIDGSGRMTIAGNSDAYVTGMSSTLASALNIVNSSSSWYTTTSSGGVTSQYSENSVGYSGSTTLKMTGDTTLSKIGLSSGTQYITLSDGTTLSFGSSDTISDIASELADYGISTSISDGKLTIYSASPTCVTGMSTNLANALHITNSGWYTTNTTYTTEDAVPDTYLSQIGVSSGTQYITLNNGTTLSFTSSSSISDIISDLAANGISAGISNGRFTVYSSSPTCITGMSSTLASALNLSDSNWYTTSDGTVTLNADSGTTLSQIGLSSGSGNQSITLNNGTTLTYSTGQFGSTTINNIISDLAANGISAGITNGRFTIYSSNDVCITGMSSALANALNLSNSNWYNASGTSTTYNADVNTTLSQIGVTGNQSITINKDGVDHVINLNSATFGSTTIGDVFDQMSVYGIQGSIANGVMTLTPTGNSYITSVSSGLAQKYGFNPSTITWSTVDTYMVGQIQINTVTTTTTETMTSATLLSEIGVTSQQTVKICDTTGASWTFTVNPSNTVGDLCDVLNASGITAGVNSGVFMIGQQTDAYIIAMDNNLMNKLKLSGAFYTTSSQTLTANTDTTLSQLGLTASKNITLRDKASNSVTGTVTIDKTDTIDDMNTKLAAYGISAVLGSDGKMTFRATGGYVIDTMDADLKTALKINSTQTFYSTSSVTPTERYHGTTISRTNFTKTLDSDTTLAQLGVNSTQTIAVTNAAGVTTSLTFASTTSMRSMIQTLAANGIACNIQDGLITFDGTGARYISSITSGMASALKVTTGGNGNSYQVQSPQVSTNVYTYNTAGTVRNAKNVTEYINGNSILSDFGLTSNGTITVVSNGATHTVTVRTDSTLDGLFSQLAAYDIQGFISDTGKVKFIGTNTSYISAFDSNAQNFFKVTAGSGQTYTTTTNTTTLTNGQGTRQTRTTTESLNMDTTMSQLGLNSSTYITVNNNGTSYTVTVSADSTVNDILTTLAGFGVAGNVSADGKVTFVGTHGGAIIGMTNTLANALKVSPGSGTSYSTPVTTSHTNTVSNPQSRVTTTSLNQNSIFSELGLSANGSFTVNYQGQNHTVNVRTDNTVGEVMTQLAALGISCSISDGKLYLAGTNDGYITAISDGVRSALKLNNAASGVTYTSSTSTTYTNNASPQRTRTGTFALDSGTTMSELGLNATTYITVNADGTQYTITVSTTTTADDIVTALGGFGISGMITDGKMTVTGTEDGYILGMTNTLASALKLNVGSGKTYNTRNIVTSGNTVSSPLSHNVVTSLNPSCTFAKLGMGSNGTVTVNHEGTNYTITVETGDTVDELLTALAGYGVSGSIAGGQLTLNGTPDGYITGISSGVATALKLSSGANVSYTTSTATTYVNTTSSSQNRNITDNLMTSSKMSDLGLTATTYVTVSNNGSDYTITVTTNQTVGDLLSTLAGFGISGSVSSDGKLTLVGTEEGYVKSMTNTLASALKLNLGNNNSYTVSTYTTSGNTVSNNQYRTITTSVNPTSTFAKLGMASDGTITVNHEGQTYTVTVTSDKTVDAILTTLAGFGIAGSTAGGKVTLTGTPDGYITSMSDNVKAALKLNVGNNNTYTTWTTTTYDNTVSNNQNRNITDYLMPSSKMSDLGLNSNTYITVNNNGTDYTITVTTSTTVDDIISTLSGYGVSGSVSGDGKLTLTGTEEGYIKGMTNTLATALKLNLGNNHSFTTLPVTTSGNTVSSNQYRTITTSLNTSATFAQLGLTDGGVITVNYQGSSRIIAVTADKTVDDILTTLAGVGISGSVSQDGKLTLSGGDDAYITAISDNVRNILKLQVGDNKTYRSWTTTTYENTPSSDQHRNDVYDINPDTLMSRLGLNSDATITVMTGGTQHVVTVSASDTIDDMLTTLAGYGISGSVSNGRVTFAADSGHYIKDMSATLKTALKLNAGSGVSWTTQNANTWVNTDSNELTMERNWLELTGDTKLSSIVGWNNGNGKLAIHQTNGHFTTITIDQTNTLDQFFNQISAYGLVGSVDTDGKVTITGVGDVYIQNVSGGSNIISALKLSGVTSNVRTLSTNKTSDTLQHTITVAATGTTQLQNIQNTSGQKITFTGNNVSLVLTSTSDAGNVNKTITFSKTDTVYDLISRLDENDITAYVDALGRFSVEASTLTDFDLSGTLGSFIMGSYTKEYGTDTTYNKTTNLVERTVFNMEDSTPLSSWGITSGNIKIVQEGVEYTVNIDTTQITTVGEFRNLLSQYGFTTEIDDHGRLSIMGIGDSRLETLAGGSNILNVFGIDHGWSRGEVTQTSDYLTDTEVLTHLTSMDRKLSELTNQDGTNLGITNGSIYVYQDGTRSAFEINNNETLQTLATRLSQYGITMGLSSDGQLYFDGNNNSYLTTEGISAGNASNILSKFQVAGEWSTRYDSTSQNLEYTVTTNQTMRRNTKLADLQDTSGNNLGITNGTYYIYEDGVRNTETITADTTVNDLMAAMATYGLIADIDEDGAISVSGYGNTYMATSALMGANSNVFEAMFNAEWDFTNVYTSNGIDVPTPEVRAITRDTHLSVLSNGTVGDYKPGYVTVIKDGVQTNISLSSDDTVGTLMDELALYGFESVINDTGQLIIRNTGDSKLQNYSVPAQASNALALLGINLDNWINTNTYEGSTLEVIKTTTSTVAVDRTTSLSELGVTTGEYNIYKNGVKFTALISSDETIGSLIDTLKSFGLEASLVVDDDGKNARIQVAGSGDSYVAASSNINASNVVNTIFTNPVNTTNEYTGLEQTRHTQVVDIIATEDTTVSALSSQWGEQMAGNLKVNVNGVVNNVSISAEDTISDVLDKFKALGLEATISNGKIMIQSGFDTLTISAGDTSSSSLANQNANTGLKYKEDLGGYAASTATVEATTTQVDNISASKFADGDTKLSDMSITNGSLSLYKDGQRVEVNIVDGETFNTFRNKVQTASGGAIDIKFDTDKYNVGRLDFSKIASVQDDQKVMLELDASAYATLNGSAEFRDNLYKINPDGTYSKLTSAPVAGSKIYVETTAAKLKSPAAAGNVLKNYVFTGNNYKDGVKAFKINNYNDGFLRFYSTNGDVSVEVGSSRDTTNMSAVLGLKKDDEGDVKSIRALYQVSGNTKVTQAGVFRAGNVTTGTFTVGTATITIDNDTTINDLVSMINNASIPDSNGNSSNVKVYWDNLRGELVMDAVDKNAGATFINIEAGTSNITDILGYTNSGRLNVESQKLGDNAVFTINGTTFTTNKNVDIDSSVHRLVGVTINLKGLSEGETVELKVERDKETVANAVSDVVDAYNQMMANLDEQLAIGGTLHKETTLRFLRDQIKNYMTRSIAGTYKNVGDIGIKTAAAASSNTSTSFSTITGLSFDKDEFIKKFMADGEATRELLIGENGVFVNLEDLMDKQLTYSSGYFQTAAKSYQTKVKDMTEKIKKANKDVERYRARLESKFQAMDMLIARINQAYSTFLQS